MYVSYINLFNQGCSETGWIGKPCFFLIGCFIGAQNDISKNQLL